MMMSMVVMKRMASEKKACASLSGVGMGAPLGAGQDCGISLGLDSIASDSGRDDDVGDVDVDNKNYEHHCEHFPQWGWFLM